MAIDKKTFVPRAILRQNLKQCMALKTGPNSQIALAKKSRVSQATIGRILSDEGVDAGIETVDKLAKVYGLDAWQMLAPGLDPTNPPVGSLSKAERELYTRLKELGREFAKDEK